MNESYEDVPTCLWCKLFDRGFPCRDADGNLDTERLVLALLSLDREERGTPKYKESFWVSACMDVIVAEEPDPGFEIILRTLAQCGTSREIACLAAGPLEKLVQSHGAQTIDRIEHEAACNERFRFLLSGIWGRSRTDPEVWQRIQKAIEEGPWIDEDPRTPQGSRKPSGKH